MALSVASACSPGGVPTAVNGNGPPAWEYPLKVRAVGPPEVDRDTFVDPMKIVWASRGKHLCNGNVDTPFAGLVSLHEEAWYVRTVDGLYRVTGGRVAYERVVERLPPTFAPAVLRGVLINLKVVPHEWDAPRDARVRRIGYRLCSPPRGSQSRLDWVRISRRCLPDIEGKLT
jgi:hypothetical protein